MKTTILPNGNLQIKCEGHDSAKLHGIKRPQTSAAESLFIRTTLAPLGYREIKPEDIGALTSAPIIQDRTGRVWGYMDYQVKSFIEELRDNKSVIWQKG